MGHQDKGHFAAKHKGRKINKTVAEKLGTMADNNCLTCALAHQAGKTLNISPAEIGVQIDLLEYRITECQLGLFGYTGKKKKIDPDFEISPDLNDQLGRTSHDGRISCLECWDIAALLKIKRLDLGSACEKKNIRIKPCQLGSF